MKGMISFACRNRLFTALELGVMFHVLFERIAVPAFLLVNGYGSRLNKILMCCAMNVFIGLHSNILVTILDLDVALFSNLVVYTVYKDEIIYDKSLSI